VTVKDADISRALSPVLAGDPAAVAARLHALPDGVHRADLPSGARIWVVSRYDDVKALLADSSLALNKRESLAG
jgi:hypothetical protein